MGFITVTLNPNWDRESADVVQLIGENMDDFVGAIGEEVRWRVAMRTPVLTGRARGSWNLSFGASPDNFFDPDSYDPDGSNGAAEAHEVARTAKAGDVIWVVSGAPYMGALERGHSRKAAPGFIALTATEAPWIAEMIAEGWGGRLHGRGESFADAIGIGHY